MMKFILFFFSLFFFPFIVYANVAPLRIPGQTLIPLGNSTVQLTSTEDIEMSSEEVGVDVQLLDQQIEQFSTKTDAYIRGRSQAFVTASFILENTSESEQNNFAMGFPLGTGGLRNVEGKLETDDFAQLQNLHVFVDGLPLEYETVSRQANEIDAAPTERWAVWPVNFGQRGSENARREVKVTYDILSSDMYFTELEMAEKSDGGPYNASLFYYILHTGRDRPHNGTGPDIKKCSNKPVSRAN